MERKETINLSYKLGLSGLCVGLIGACIEFYFELIAIGSVLFWVGWLMVIAGMIVGISASRKKNSAR